MSSTSNPMLSADFMESLMKDPAKKALILQLINQEKDNLETFRRQELKNKTTPLKKTKKLHCESPSALQRRRALEQQSSESSSSEFSEPATQVVGPKLPYEQLLKGVKAYVEVKRDNVDRSDGIKAVMQAMGATIKDKFTSDVTHVIFKDGSFTTFEKAKLMRKHLVSVLWLDAVRRHNARVSEKNYPAFGSRVCDQNVSVLCSQIQKDYEEIVKDEKRRRRTMMTPKTSMNSYLGAQNLHLSDDDGGTSSRTSAKSPELTSDDSDCGVINGHTTKRSRNRDLLQTSPQLTDDASSIHRANSSTDSTSLLSKISVRNKRPMINVISNIELTPKLNSEMILEATPGVEVRKSKKILKDSTFQSTTRTSPDTDKTKSDLVNSKQSETNKENQSLTTIDSTMSSLRLSEASNERRRSRSNSKLKETTKQNQRSSSSSSNLRNNRSKSSVTEDRSPSVTRSSKKITRALTESSGTDTPELPKSISKRTRRMTSVTSSVSSLVSERESLNKRNRRSVSVTPSKLESPKTETVKRNRTKNVPETENIRSRRSTSVVASLESPKKRNRRVTSIAPSNLELASKKVLSVSLEDLHSSKPHKNNKKSEETPKKKISEGSQSSPPKKTRVEKASSKKTRKLYNPNELTGFSLLEDDKEREEYVKQKVQKTPEEVFLNPNTIHIAPPSSKRRSKNNSSTSDWSSDDSEAKAIKQKPKTKKGNKKYKTPPKRDSALDEQKELLELLNKSEQKRHSQRLFQSQTIPKYTFTSSGSLSSSSLPISPIKRRSTLDFVTSTEKRKLKLDPKRSSSIVCTKMHRQEVVNFERVVSNLGRFFVEDQVTGKTSHLVAGESKRTINILRALARGCWILKHEWLLKSQEEGKWMNEEDYELTEFSPAVQQCRIRREAFGPLYSMDIFQDCGFIYVGKTTSPKASDLKELISICKGKVTAVYRNAAISVGEFYDKEGLSCVTEMWILDSVLFNKLKSFKKYLVKPIGENNSPHF